MAARNRGHRPPSRGRPLPLDTARECFALLVSGPQPLTVDGRDFPGLPDRPVPLDELRERLLRGRCSRGTRDAVWAHLVRRSREAGAVWTLACAGMALPALAGVVRKLKPRFPGDVWDLHADVLAGFLGALAAVDVDRPRVLVRLRWAAYRAGRAALSEALEAPLPVAGEFRSCPPQVPWGHPDLVLARAVRMSVLSRSEADLIGSTRLEEVPVADWADRHRTGLQAAYKARRRAELRLAVFLREQTAESDPDDPVASFVTGELTAPATGLSKTGRDSGLLGCRGFPNSPASRTASEVR